MERGSAVKPERERAAEAMPSKMFNHGAGEFADKFNVLPFSVSHNLGEHPLFELPRLAKLAATLWELAAGKVVAQEGTADFGNRWDEIPNKALSLIKGIREIEQSNAWVLLKSIQEDPEYSACIDQCLAELSELTGMDLKKEITWMDGYIFIASPGAVTPHHIDHESNFLLQIHGDKQINVCDPNDRSVLFEDEIENYYAGDLSAARFKPVSQEKAYVFPMEPGKGVHIPSKGPHWVRNGNKYSVSFSINFCMRQTDVRSRIYQCNHYLRRLDFDPTPPGQSSVKDLLKLMATSRLANGRASNKYELLRKNLKRLDRASRVFGKVLGRSVAPAAGEIANPENEGNGRI
ncbi:MAG: cupin-like domain-containing protein [Acidobacteriota bacterium]|nr:MAG: cupin-like domain-containing protein [Acidobacteriota bacterium]